ncbi:MAG: glycoside hydrolase family 13 protein [Bacteroidales bacterium]
MIKRLFLAVIIVAALVPSCTEQKPKTVRKLVTGLDSVPAWSRNAIWYQIFVERFRNGDSLNDPTVADMKGGYPDKYPASWKVTPWGHDWYEREPWVNEMADGNFYSRIQARRYGGDLQGVLDEIDYIDSLGVNVIYFNPLNDSPSLHKYDARNYIHIDRNFGPSPAVDEGLMRTEDPGDPATWKWTTADKLFLKVVSEFHKRGIRVILDYSWNHTGKDFWALEDIRKKGKNSLYTDWYNILQYDDPSTPANEFRYEGWGGSNIYMPVFKKDIVPADDKEMPFEGNFHSAKLKSHIFSVSKRWLDPDGNGDPSDGIDGFRLDVAAEVPMGFWREYRKVVRSVNPDAYLVGEVWWLRWPDKLIDPAIFMGDQFDAIMNYRWFRLARGFFGQAEPILTPSGFVESIATINKGLSVSNQQAMMNVVATHDSPRLSTSLFNKTMDKYNAKPSDNPDYKINKPDAKTLEEQKLLLVHQFTFVGSPHIWNGDEVGMWGADDPDCRKPMVWDDIVYSPEKANFTPGKFRPVDEVKVDHELFEFYRSLVKMRKENPVLSSGNLKFIVADDEKFVLGYSRKSGDDEVLAFFNRSPKEQTVVLPGYKRTQLNDLFVLGQGSASDSENGLSVQLGSLSALVLKRISK